MLTQERYRTILDLLNKQNAVTVTELAALMETSESTIRRDLNALAKEGRLNKVFGGATSIKRTSGVMEEKLAVRESIMVEEKNRIALYASRLIYDDDLVYIDSGTTTALLAEHIDNKKATYVTNGVAQAQRLVRKGLNVYIIGGRIKPITEAAVGAEALRSIENFNFTKAFLGTNGIDLEAGFTTPDIEEALVKRKATEKAYTAFVLSDSSKFRVVSAITFSDLSRCCIITDKITDRAFAEKTVIKEVLQ